MTSHPFGGDVLGRCCIVLHSHLPYVHHPDFEDFLEEDWLFEAMAETYLPLLFVMRDLRRDNVPFKLAFSMTPPLVHMLRSPSLQTKFDAWLTKKLELSRREVQRLSGDRRMRECAEHYVRRFGQVRSLFEAVNRDIPAAFAELQNEGWIEILASAATHGYLPLLGEDLAVRAQINLGVDNYRQTFGRRPRGFWLPECAMRPGLETALRDAGIEWIVLETNGVNAALPRPFAGTFRPVTIQGGLTALGRDPESSRQVWSGVVGYPGDPDYRELYRDLGYEADYKYVRPFLKPDGVRRHLGLKYHRVTGKVALHDKDVWSPSAAQGRARIHADDFLDSRVAQIRLRRDVAGEPVVVLAPYDTELFGHWWYEGPHFIEALFRQARWRGASMPFIFSTPSEALDAGGSRPEVWTHETSWGAGSFYRVWLNEKNQWIWRHVHEIEARMVHRAANISLPTAEERRILNQMGRELLLAESSDWPFIIAMDTASYYAEQRVRTHVHRFLELDRALSGAPLPEAALADMEKGDAMFPGLDYRTWARP